MRVKKLSRKTNRPWKVERNWYDVSRIGYAVFSENLSCHFTESTGSVCVDLVLIVFETDSKIHVAWTWTRWVIITRGWWWQGWWRWWHRWIGAAVAVLISGQRIVKVIETKLKDSRRRDLRNQENYQSKTKNWRDFLSRWWCHVRKFADVPLLFIHDGSEWVNGGQTTDSKGDDNPMMTITEPSSGCFVGWIVRSLKGRR